MLNVWSIKSLILEISATFNNFFCSLTIFSSFIHFFSFIMFFSLQAKFSDFLLGRNSAFVHNKRLFSIRVLRFFVTNVSSTVIKMRTSIITKVQFRTKDGALNAVISSPAYLTLRDFCFFFFF